MMKKKLLYACFLTGLAFLWISTPVRVQAQYYYLADETNLVTLHGKSKDFRFSTPQEIGISINDVSKTIRILFKVDIFKPIEAETEKEMLFNCITANTYPVVAYLGTYQKLALPKEGETNTLLTKGALEMSGKSLYVQLPLTIKNVNGTYYVNINYTEKLNLEIVPDRYKPLLQGMVNYEFSGILKNY